MHLMSLGEVPQYVVGLDLGATIRWVGDNLGEEKNSHFSHQGRNSSRRSCIGTASLHRASKGDKLNVTL